jgi:hypothetical protein
VSRRPTGPQAAAVLASLSVNALLFLGLRQVGTPSTDAAVDDVVPLLVIETEAQDPHARSRPSRRSPASAKAARPGRSTRRRRPAALTAATTSAQASAPTAALAHHVAADDRWTGERGQDHARFPTALQRSLAEPAPRIARPSVLAGVAFRDGSFAGLLARLAKVSDCGELQAAMVHHPESAATIAGTMERLGCRP